MITDNIADKILQDITAKIKDKSLKLASLPDIILKVNDVLADERKGVNDIVKVIQNEVALSVRIIHIANSPALRGSKEITSMSEAINRLGLELVKNLAICVSLKDRFNTKNVIHTALMEKEIRVSIERSIYGFMIAKHLYKLAPEFSLLAGLVSQIGDIVLLRYISDSPTYKTMIEKEAEYIAGQIGNTIGEMILEQWGFPKDIISAIFSDSTDQSQRTYRGVYLLTNAYLESKDNFDDINSMIKTYQDEFKSLELMFS